MIYSCNSEYLIVLQLLTSSVTVITCHHELTSHTEDQEERGLRHLGWVYSYHQSGQVVVILHQVSMKLASELLKTNPRNNFYFYCHKELQKIDKI